MRIVTDFRFRQTRLKSPKPIATASISCSRPGRGLRKPSIGRSRPTPEFRARAYRPRADPFVLSAGRGRTERSRRRAGTGGAPRHGARAEPCRDAGAGRGRQSSGGTFVRAQPSRKLSARCGGDVAAARRVRAVRVFRHGGARPGAAGAVRALRAALRRGLVVPVQLRLGHDGKRRGHQGTRDDRARLRHAPRQCLRRACAAARDVRGRIGRGCRCAGHPMDRRLRPQRDPLRPYLLASGARRARSGRRIKSALDLREESCNLR